MSTSTVPLTWRVASFHTTVAGVPTLNDAMTLLWQVSQAAEAGCPVLVGGGVRWQAVPQAFHVSLTWFQTGVVLAALAPDRLVPWQ